MPVTDNIEFSDYDVEKNASDNDGSFTNAAGEKFKGSNSLSPFVPLATAVTYFGEDTGNKLSDILSFSAGYKWAELSTGDGKDPISISAAQNDEGSNLVNGNGGGGRRALDGHRHAEAEGRVQRKVHLLHGFFDRI